jgi:hypothetical protein
MTLREGLDVLVKRISLAPAGNQTQDGQVIIVVFSGSAAQRGLWPPLSRGFLITHNDAPQSVELLLDE